MKKILNQIVKLLPHATLILAVIFITFLILDQYNPMMNFVNNDTSMKLLGAFCILTLINSGIVIVKNINLE
ncbi:hypothetical protein C8E03_104141 [Lachnotalea glycerini]|jgi:hypothetical protein|uniref:ABC transporter permease n=1 Tax=Lachnotalea glycerini TaxID=1763509 RepID=A0A318ESB9_9FIRM|nr:hypothetical protein [Lachnotalea glycerini]OYO84485.1 hypothetical protein CG709_14870 [Lachnotalea glycerini]PXV91133.1 hypothetical protein C8E03_104141 [Lachnotalea glycerini]RDY28615.1 hypothetical protein CG710_019425 [Lachnotalea glycerini]